jgi:hypothetical protein
MINKRSDGSYATKEVPGLGSPFSSRVLRSMGRKNQVPAHKQRAETHLPAEFADEIITSTFALLHRIGDEHFDITLRNEGPFPLRHTDFLHSNITVDAEFNVLSIIDWKNAGTVPWERAEIPDFLYTKPEALDLPSGYDADRRPLEEDKQKMWEEREKSVRSVAEAERNMRIDDSLSLDTWLALLTIRTWLHVSPVMRKASRGCIAERLTSLQ